MLNDPEFDKMIIYGLAGVCIVLLLAVIFLAVKKNVYYVDEEGREVPDPKRTARRAKRKQKTEPEPEMAEEPAEEPVPEPEPELIPASEPEVPVAEEEIETVIPQAPVFMETPAEEAEPEIVSFPSKEPEVFESSDEPLIPEIEEEPETAAAEEDEPDLARMFPMDEEEPEEPEAEYAEEEYTEAEPAPAIPVPVGCVVTVTVAGQSQTHEVDTLPCLIGREQTSCNLVISEPAVSRRHARIYANEEGLFIEDVSEHNGTYLNGTKLPSLGSAQLNENDRVSLGRAELVISRILY